MNRPTLYLRPVNGLCNRMRAIMYWSAFADATNRNFTILWGEGEGFDSSPYDQLFQIYREWSVEPYAEWNGSDCLNLNDWISPEGGLAREEQGAPRISDFLVLGKYEKDDLFIEASAGATESDYMNVVKNSVFLSSLKKCMKPSLSLETKIEELTTKFRERTIGLHIRGNDAWSANNENSKHYDSLTGTEKWHSVIGEESPNAVFYLSTDAQDVENQFMDLYGERIITQSQKEFHVTETWEEKPGQSEALIDLFCLGRTGRVVGTSWSSFSEIAHLLSAK